jgi:hypothetical protein
LNEVASAKTFRLAFKLLSKQIDISEAISF